MIGAADAIRARLASDPVLTELATGGVWDRPLARDGRRATPAAYEVEKPHQLKPSIVVIDNGDVDDFAGPAGARTGFVQVWLHATSSAPGRAALNALASRIAGLFRRDDGDLTVLPEIGPGGAEVTYADRLGITDDPGDDAQLVDYLRLQVSGIEGGS